MSQQLTNFQTLPISINKNNRKYLWWSFCILSIRCVRFWYVSEIFSFGGIFKNDIFPNNQSYDKNVPRETAIIVSHLCVEWQPIYNEAIGTNIYSTTFCSLQHVTVYSWTLNRASQRNGFSCSNVNKMEILFLLIWMFMQIVIDLHQ